MLILTVALALAACGSDDAESEDLEPDDPPDLITATANGVAIALNPHGQILDAPITIEEITLEEGTQLSEDFVAAFRLLPAGATFDTPVTLSLTLAGVPEAALTGFHFSEGAPTELMEFLPVAYDPAADETTYEAHVSHFSELQIEHYGQQVETRILPDIPGDRYLVRDSFVMRVRVVARSLPSFDRGLYKGTDVRVVSNRPPALTLDAHWRTSGAPLGIDFSDAVSLTYLTRGDEFAGSPLTPVEAEGVPKTQLVSDGQTVDFEQEFTCVSPGRFYVWFRGHQTEPGVATEYRGTTVVATEAVTRYGYANTVITGECVVPEASATSAPGTSLAIPTPVTGTATPGTSAGEVIPTVVLPPEPGIPTPVTGTGTLEGFIKVYAYGGVWYYADALAVTEAHEPHCSYVHLHGGPITAVPIDGLTLPPLAEMYGECGFGPTNALYWIRPPN